MYTNQPKIENYINYNCIMFLFQGVCLLVNLFLSLLV